MIDFCRGELKSKVWGSRDKRRRVEYRRKQQVLNRYSGGENEEQKITHV